MSNSNDRNDQEKDDLFLKRSRDLFAESADSLDGQARSRLNRSRQEALAELDSGAISLGRWTQWAPVAGVASVAVVAVVLLGGNPKIDQIIDQSVSQPGSDFELLIAEDSFDMLQDLDFYSWIDMDAELNGGLGTGADIG